MAKFVSADYHLGHEGIIASCGRPWKNAHAMEKAIVSNHNSVIGDDDDLYLAGDLSLATKSHRGSLENMIRKLKGRIHLILGNHDIRDPRFWSELGIWSIHYPYLEVDEFVIVHDPALSAVDRKRPFICGHVHELFTFKKNVYNAGIDVAEGYKPIPLNDIRHFFIETAHDEPDHITVDKKYIDMMKQNLVMES